MHPNNKWSTPPRLQLKGKQWSPEQKFSKPAPIQDNYEFLEQKVVQLHMANDVFQQKLEAASKAAGIDNKFDQAEFSRINQIFAKEQFEGLVNPNARHFLQKHVCEVYNRYESVLRSMLSISRVDEFSWKVFNTYRNVVTRKDYLQLIEEAMTSDQKQMLGTLTSQLSYKNIFIYLWDKSSPSFELDPSVAKKIVAQYYTLEKTQACSQKVLDPVTQMKPGFLSKEGHDLVYAAAQGILRQYMRSFYPHHSEKNKTCSTQIRALERMYQSYFQQRSKMLMKRTQVGHTVEATEVIKVVWDFFYYCLFDGSDAGVSYWMTTRSETWNPEETDKYYYGYNSMNSSAKSFKIILEKIASTMKIAVLTSTMSLFPEKLLARNLHAVDSEPLTENMQEWFHILKKFQTLSTTLIADKQNIQKNQLYQRLKYLLEQPLLKAELVKKPKLLRKIKRNTQRLLTGNQTDNIAKLLVGCNSLQEVDVKVKPERIQKEILTAEVQPCVQAQIDCCVDTSKVTADRMSQLQNTFESIEIQLRFYSGHLELNNKSWNLLIYGSTTNCLASSLESDLDLTLIIDDDFTANHENVLWRVKKILQMMPNRFSDIQDPLQIQSGVILQFYDCKNKIEVDISVNRVLEVLNSQLIFSYGAFDQRFIRLALVLKRWNKTIFTDKKTRLNSFCINLMLIGFLQHKKILPNLQGHAEQSRPTKYQIQVRKSDYVGLTDTRFIEPKEFHKCDLLQFCQPSGDQNLELLSEAELLTEFFHFYGTKFSPDLTVVDISHKDGPFRDRQDFIDEVRAIFSENQQILRQPLLSRPESFYMLVVDPFNKTYTAAKIPDQSIEAKNYRGEFQRAFVRLSSGKALV